METTQPLDRAEARLPRWMAAAAALVAGAALAMGHARFAGGFALGSLVSILGYSWLHQAIERALTFNQGRLPKGLVVKFAVRYPLLLGAVFLFYRTGWLPFNAALAGLMVPVAGAMLECFYQVGEALRR
jgi:ATP synthase I subunit